MIKVKLLNSSSGRNENTFDNLAAIHWKLRDLGIELLWHKRTNMPKEIVKKAETSDYDFLENSR